MKILLTSEFTHLNTGYASYYREIAKSLHKHGHEVIELACYGDANNLEHVRALKSIPWNVYLNIPPRNQPDLWNAFEEREKHYGDAKHGAWCFENICLQEKPDIVISLRDYWYDRYIIESPLRKYFHLILSPTVDAMPQRPEWIDGFSRVDTLTTYNDWSNQWLKDNCNLPNLVPSISPGENTSFRILNKTESRKQMGLPLDAKIVGTVMRNQFRKLFPMLFEVIGKTDLTLYCHTGYPDRGWEFADYLLDNRIYDRTFFSYKCDSCHKILALKFQDSHPRCKNCGGTLNTCNVQNGATETELNVIYNTFDIYCQLHNSEGFGIPPLEAAQAGIRSISTDYAAQSDIIRKIGGIPLRVQSLERDFETECNRAIPDRSHLLSILCNPDTYDYDRESIRQETLHNYNWDKTTKQWLALVENVVPKNMWQCEPDIRQPIDIKSIEHLPNEEFVKSCIFYVACQPSLFGSLIHADTLHNLNTGIFIPKDKYGHKMNTVERVNKEKVYNKFLHIRQKINVCEQKRISLLQKQEK